MKTTIKFLLVVLYIMIVAACNSDRQKKAAANLATTNDATPLKSVKDMQSDLAILWSVIKEMHPGYGFYTPVDSLQKMFNKTYSALQVPLTENQYIAVIYPFLCDLRCGHTQIKHSEGYKAPGTKQIGHLPFQVLVRNHRAWVTSRQTDQLNTGDEIIAVNDTAVSEIVNYGYNFYNGDGYNETFKELFLGEYDGFEDVCRMHYHWREPYRLKLRGSSGKIKIIQVKKTSYLPSNATKIDNYNNWTTEKSIPDGRLRFMNNGAVALFQSTPFAYADTVIFRDAFRLIRQKKTKTLIVDLRHNSGGDIRVATQLLSYLADSSFRIVKDVRSRLPDPASNSFASYFDPSVTQGFKSGFKRDFREGTWYHIAPKPAFGDLFGPFSLNKIAHFNGKLIVLIDGATFSSGALLAAAVKAQRKDVLFVGRETAGSEEGCNGVTLQKLTLPNTKIVVDFPWMRVISMAKRPIHGRGVMPDYPVLYSPKDIVTENDVDLKKALSLVN
jgi:hypothetical protein